jgi:hypothetical protein
MHVIARIRFQGGMLMLPSRTPYDVETLVENLDWYTARHRRVQLVIGHHRWWVEHGADEDAGPCRQCGRARPTLTFVNGSRVGVCAACVRAAVSSRFAYWPRERPPFARAG